MKFLVLGAGATGGYFGGRLAQAGADIKFLVRPGRAAQLAADGLVIESAFGNAKVLVKTVSAEQLTAPHDVVILSCKAYALEESIAAIRPAVGPDTHILPLLNGIKHLDALEAAFGAERVLGGSCHLSVTLGDDGVIRHLNQLHLLTFGPRRPDQLPACRRIYQSMASANFELKLREDMMQAMWDKWVLLASLAGLTCLFRASVGEIMATPAGRGLMLASSRSAAASPRPAGSNLRRNTSRPSAASSPIPSSKVVASMLRDMQKGGPVEADLIIGDMLRRGREAGLKLPVLEIADTNLACYQAQRLVQA